MKKIFILLVLTPLNLFANEMKLDGVQTIFFNSSDNYVDFTIPVNIDPSEYILNINVAGADGGYAKSCYDLGHLDSGCSHANGGKGAEISATYYIGDDGIPLGKKLRFIVGEAGQNYSSTTPGPFRATAGAGGGGGSGVLYFSETGHWEPLIVTGAGGGGFVKEVVSIHIKHGQSATATDTSGVSATGTTIGNEGSGGKDGSGGSRAYLTESSAGGGYYGDAVTGDYVDWFDGFWGLGGGESKYGGNSCGNTGSLGGNKGRKGGFGCGSGGASWGNTTWSSGGAGGGYSGGGAFNSQKSGAGGSYINTDFSPFEIFKWTKHYSTNNPTNGYISYYFSYKNYNHSIDIKITDSDDYNLKSPSNIKLDVIKNGVGNLSIAFHTPFFYESCENNSESVKPLLINGISYTDITDISTYNYSNAHVLYSINTSSKAYFTSLDNFMLEVDEDNNYSLNMSMNYLGKNLTWEGHSINDGTINICWF